MEIAMNKRGVVCLSIFIMMGSACSSSLVKARRIQLKEFAFISCQRWAMGDSSLQKKDVSWDVYRDIGPYQWEVYSEVDSIAKSFAASIQPSPISDHNNKKAIAQECFQFYNSKFLDSLVRKYDKRLNAPGFPK